MTYVSIVRYLVRFNGAPSLSRGLWQGDPLSPYLFILVADGLFSLLRHYESLGQTEGLKVCRRAPSITHLLFADDSLLFFRANQGQATAAQNVLNIFQKVYRTAVESEQVFFVF